MPSTTRFRVHGGRDFTRYREPLDSGVQRRLVGRTPEFGHPPWPPAPLLHAHENSQGSSSRGTKSVQSVNLIKVVGTLRLYDTDKSWTAVGGGTPSSRENNRMQESSNAAPIPTDAEPETKNALAHSPAQRPRAHRSSLPPLREVSTRFGDTHQAVPPATSAFHRRPSCPNPGAT